MEQAELIQYLEQIAPPELADFFDDGRLGLVLDLLFTKNGEINRIAVALDMTDAVLQKAADFNADLLICHHPPFFRPLTSVPESLARRLKIAFDNGISVYSMHSNYDNVADGINGVLAEIFGLRDILITNTGVIGTIDPIATEDFAKIVSEKLNTPVLYAGSRTIQKLMVCGGSGLDRRTLFLAKENDVDALLSSELKHSDVLRERGDMTIIDAGHYATENPGMRFLAKRMAKDLEGKADVLFIEDDPELKAV